MQVNQFLSYRMTKPALRVSVGSFLSFLTGLLAFYFVPFGGQLYLSDIFCVSVAALYLLSGQANQLVRILGTLGCVLLVGAVAWLIQQICTDLIRQTVFDDLIRGWSKIAIFISCIIVVSMFTRQKMGRLVICACGYAVGKIIETAVFPSGYEIGTPWKFGYSIPVTILVIAYLSYFHKRQRIIFVPAAFIALGIVNIAMNFRSMFLFCLVSAAACFFSDIVKLVAAKHKLSFGFKVPIVIVAIGITAFSAKTAYEYMAVGGMLGIEAQQKYYSETSGDLNILQAGRNESFVSTVAIKNSPIMGYGSWAKSHDYAVMQIEVLRQKHIEAQYSEDDSLELIPSHSYVLGAWVESGIVGALFWVIAFAITFAALLVTIGAGGSFMGLNFFLFINLLWSIPFSPFTADTRLSVAIILCLALSVLKSANVERIFRAIPRRSLRRA